MNCKNLAAASLIFAALASGCSKEGKGPGGPGGFQMPPTPVEVAPVKQETVTDRFEAVGSMEAAEEVVVVAEIQGQVESLPFEEGTAVRRGQVLAHLDDTELAAEVSRAEAIRDQSRLAYDRWKKVVDQKAGAAQDLDDALARLRVAEADLELSRARLEKSNIVAPFDGVVGARQVSPGAFLHPGDEVASMAKMDEMRITFSAPERYVPMLRKGARVAVGVTAYPDKLWSGRIDVVEPVLDPTTRSVRIMARVANLDAKLRPGMSANISATLSERPNALTIPSEAVVAEGETFFVYIVNPDSTVARVPLTLGARTAESVEVLGQLEPGTSVVRSGHQKLFPGAKVMMIPSGGPGGPMGPGGPGEGGTAGADVGAEGGPAKGAPGASPSEGAPAEGDPGAEATKGTEGAASTEKGSTTK